jgi:hypothetical protein
MDDSLNYLRHRLAFQLKCRPSSSNAVCFFAGKAYAFESIRQVVPLCVYEAIIALEATGVFSWVNRIDRVAERVKDLFGNWMMDYRIVRRSNVYQWKSRMRDFPNTLIQRGSLLAACAAPAATSCARRSSRMPFQR